MCDQEVTVMTIIMYDMRYTLAFTETISRRIRLASKPVARRMRRIKLHEKYRNESEFAERLLQF